MRGLFHSFRSVEEMDQCGLILELLGYYHLYEAKGLCKLRASGNCAAIGNKHSISCNGIYI